MSCEYLLFSYCLVFFGGHLFYQSELNSGLSQPTMHFLLIGGLASACYVCLKKSSVGLLLLAVFWMLLYYINPYVNFISFLILDFFLIFLSVHYNEKISPAEKQLAFDGFSCFLGCHYFITGILKTMSAAWRNGEALFYIKSSVLGSSVAVSFPDNLLMQSSWLVIALELGGVLLVFKKLRRFVLPLLFIFHLGIGLFLNIFQLTLVYLLILLWMFVQSSKCKPI